jgi:hypothetical protein
MEAEKMSVVPAQKYCMCSLVLRKNSSVFARELECVCAFYDPGVLIFFSGDGRWESTATMLVALKNGQAQNLYPVLFLWSLAGLCPLQC